MPADLQVGLIGPNASRSGLGPFLASHLLAHGARVTAVASSSAERAAVGAVALTARLGHPVRACASAAALCQLPLAAVVIASPPEHHLAGLQAALAAGLPVLCEKPLVAAEQGAAGAAVVAGFAHRGLLLAENCQWPMVLPALAQLHGPMPALPVRRVALGLGPRRAGRCMFADSLSHLLALCQAVAPLGPATVLRHMHLADPTLQGDRNVLSVQLTSEGDELAAELHLQQCLQPPRPAWLQVDERRMDRQIGADYGFAFVGNGRQVPVADPMGQLVGDFVAALRAPDAAAIDRGHGAIGLRLRLYGEIMARIG